MRTVATAWPAAGMWLQLACLCLLVLLADTQTNYGKRFILAAPYGGNVSGSVGDIQLVLTNPGSLSITVTMSFQGTNSSIVVLARSAFTTSLAAATHMLPVTEGVYNRALVVTSTDTCGVHLFGTKAYDGYLAIPVASWGTRYNVLTHCRGPSAVCQLVVMADQDFTNVAVTLPAENHRMQADDPGTTYAAGETKKQVLMKGEIWVLTRPYELSATSVVSNASVGVLAGAQVTWFEGYAGAMIEQFPPIRALGLEHVTVTLTSRPVRVLAIEPQTTVHFSNYDSVRLSKRGDFYQKSSSSAMYIRSDRPVLVIQLGVLGTSSGRYPVMTVLQPTRQGLDNSTGYVVPNIFLTNQWLMIVTRNKFLDSIQHNGQLASTFNRLDVPNTDYQLIYVPLNSVLHGQLVTSDAPDVMNVYIMAETVDGGFVTPLAAQFEIIVSARNCDSTTQAVPGDTVDNDCDGLVDEDDCATSSGIDCSLPVSGGVRDVWGTDFVFALPEHVGNESSLNFSLTVTTTSTSHVDVNFTRPGQPTERYDLVDTAPYIYYFVANTSVTLTGDRSSRAWRVTSTREVSVTLQLYGEVQGQLTSGSMRLIPTDALGNEHYLFSSCNKEPCHFQIVGVYPETDVDIHLRFSPSTSNLVVFEGMTYVHKDVIHTTVGVGEGLQLQGISGCSLTGTLVTASKPLGVFSFSAFVESLPAAFDKDHVLEQMPPVSSYGTEFFVKQAPERINSDHNYCDVENCTDTLFVVATQPNTTITVANGEAGVRVTKLNILAAGEYVAFDVNENSTQMVTDKPVLVVQMMKDLVASDGSMLVVTPKSQYTTRDVFAFHPDKLSIKKRLVLYSIGELISGLTVDTVSRTYTTQVAGPLLNASYLVLPYDTSSMTYLDAMTSGAFGGYIESMTSFLDDVASLAFRLESSHWMCNVTKPTHGDGIDNDCDGAVDEEPCLIATEEDTDGDGRFNEDCKALPEVTTQFQTTVTTPEVTTQSETTVTTSEVTTAVTTSNAPGTTSQAGVTTLQPSSVSSNVAASSQNTATTSVLHTSGSATVAASVITSTATPALSSTATTSTQATPAAAHHCGCSCPPWVATTTIAPESLTSVLESIRSELHVDKSELSSTRRKKISEPDDRPSAQTVGYIGVIIIAGIVVGIFLLDVGALHRDFSNLVAACRDT